MRFMAMEHAGPSADGSPTPTGLLRDEAARVLELYTAGLVREVCFRTDTHEAILFMEVDDADTAKAIIGSLPLVEAGLIGFEIIPLGPYDGFKRLVG